MARRKMEVFNLSLLDLLTSALGAVIFLFIITPKGGEAAATVQQAMVYFDTTQMKIHGSLPDSLLHKQPGDTLFTVLVAHQELPKEEQKAPIIVKLPNRAKETKAPPRKIERPSPSPKPAVKDPVTKPIPPTPSKPEPVVVEQVPTYRGDAPSVPCNLSVEISWGNVEDNVDLFLCKGNSCVYGGRKKDRQIGNWDSGKSRNRLFGNDLRTTQEAVRQFDKIIPGSYQIYAQFKEGKQNRQSLRIKGLIYTKNAKGEERGEAFTKQLSISKERKLIGTLIVKIDGSYQFIRK